jgi:group II intron reverse transcriptase/maturase
VTRNDPAEGRSCRDVELFEGMIMGTSSSNTVSTKLERIAGLAKQMQGKALTSLAHHIDLEWMREAYRRTRKDGAPGVDGMTAREYEQRLEENLQELLGRAKSGERYRAPPVRRVYIPKGSGDKLRPIGIPTFEDKVLQRAVVMAMEAVYEQDFHPCSYGFRTGKGAHDALHALREEMMEMHGGWVLEADIEKFFDSVDHAKLRSIVEQRVRDGVVLRLIGKWLNAGVMEEGSVYYPDAGTPQGGVISPLLANIYLHEVLDSWWYREVKPRLKGRASLVRYADDFVMLFEREDDARRVQDVLTKRFERYGLRLHPEKTRLVRFQRPPKGGEPPDGTDGSSFDLLGFTLYWARSLKGNWVVKLKTEQSRFSRTLHAIRAWLRTHMHDPIRDQHRALQRRLRGHDAYYGVTGNYPALARLRHEVERAWQSRLGRRSRAGYVTWSRMRQLLRVFPLPPPRVLHTL